MFILNPNPIVSMQHNTIQILLSIFFLAYKTYILVISFALQVSNRQLLDTILSKRKVLLDQLRKGLETLGVLEEAAKRPLMFESFFVSSDENLTSDKVKGSLTFTGDMDDDQVQTMAYFLQFVDECTKEGT